MLLLLLLLVQGMDTTLPVTLEDMIHHTQAVKRCVLWTQEGGT